MSSNESTIRDAILALTRTFALRPIDAAAFARANGAWDAYHRYREFDQGVQGRTWDQLGSAFVDTHGGALFHLDPAAFVAVLPAYLVALLRNEVESQASALTFSQLTRDPRPEKFDARLKLLDPSQREAIILALQILRNGGDWPSYRSDLAAAIASFSASTAPTSGH